MIVPDLTALSDSRFDTDLFEQLTGVESGKLIEPAKLSAIYIEDPTKLANIRYTFSKNFRTFDKILLKIHYRRDREFSSRRREHIVRFLSSGYLISGDVRYFNELLFFAATEHDQYLALCHRQFHKNLLKSGHHRFPLATREDVLDYVSSHTLRASSNEIPPGTKIALLGSPVLMAPIHAALKDDCQNIDTWFFTWDRQRSKRMLKRIWPIQKLFFLLKKIRLNYRTINDHFLSDQITSKLQKHGYSVGIHHLPFIVKNNVISAFHKGILNDHLAILPYIRGRSTIEYSLLFGFPIGATVHFIDEGVDTGPIVKMYSYDLPENDRLALDDVKRVVLEHESERFKDALKCIMGDKFETQVNVYEDGLQYYSIHSALTDYINRAILGQYGSCL